MLRCSSGNDTQRPGTDGHLAWGLLGKRKDESLKGVSDSGSRVVAALNIAVKSGRGSGC